MTPVGAAAPVRSTRLGRTRRGAVVAGAVFAVLVVAGCGSAGTKAGSAPPAARTTAPPASASAGTTSAPAPSTAYGFYLSLGDSLAFGFQLARFQSQLAAHSYSPGNFDTGYSDLVLTALRRTQATIASANLGCPGETTATFEHGACPTVLAGEALHVAYPGSQQAAAAAFLRAHPGPGLITVALGANDLNGVLGGCPDLSVSCIEPKLPAIFTQVQTNLTAILTALRTEAPQAKIVVLQLYNPYVVSVAASDFVVQALNAQIGAAARAAGVSTADAYPSFNGTGAEKQTICRLTAYCSAARDIHPTDAGYEVLANLFLRAAGAG